MKNNYLISPNYLIQLENEELRERIKKLIADYKELKNLYDTKLSVFVEWHKYVSAAIYYTFIKFHFDFKNLHF
jgi:regulator of replication initiation timing